MPDKIAKLDTECRYQGRHTELARGEGGNFVKAQKICRREDRDRLAGDEREAAQKDSQGS